MQILRHQVLLEKLHKEMHSLINWCDWPRCQSCPRAPPSLCREMATWAWKKREKVIEKNITQPTTIDSSLPRKWIKRKFKALILLMKSKIMTSIWMFAFVVIKVFPSCLKIFHHNYIKIRTNISTNSDIGAASLICKHILCTNFRFRMAKH